MASNLASIYVPEPNPASTGSALRAVHETPGSSRTAASRRVNSGRRLGIARTGWLYDPALVLKNDDDDECGCIILFGSESRLGFQRYNNATCTVKITYFLSAPFVYNSARSDLKWSTTHA